MSTRTQVSCAQCGKVFTLMPSAARSKLKRNDGKVFCSSQCSADFQRVPDVELTCFTCGKRFMVQAKEARKRLKQAHQFCNIQCRNRWVPGRGINDNATIGF
jgi:hypothetical protein